jgi:hypothetical protein
MLPWIVALMLSAPATAAPGQPPVDALRSCLADSTSGKDRKDLAKWVFLSMAAHPAMKQHVGPGTEAAAEESSQTVALLFQRLLTTSCVTETKAVFKVGQGAQAIQLAFQGLGQLAMQELMTDKSVQDSMGKLERYVDQKRIAEVFSGK